MIPTLTAWLAPRILSVTAWLAGILALLAVFAKVRQGGRDAEKVDNMKKENAYAKEIIRQDGIVAASDTDGMSSRLDAAIVRHQRDTHAPDE